MQWSRAVSYGVKFFLLSAAFTIIGLIMLASALSIKVTTSNGDYVLNINLALLNNVGVVFLAALGLTILIIGNAVIFFKLLSEIIRECSPRDIW